MSYLKNYEIGKLLGKGAYGKVYKARKITESYFSYFSTNMSLIRLE